MPVRRAESLLRRQRPGAYECVGSLLISPVHEKQSTVPIHDYTGTATPHNRLQPCVGEWNDGLRIDPSNVINKCLHIPARVKRTTVERQDVTGVVSAPPCRSESLARQSSRALVGPETHKACGEIARCAVGCIVYDASGGRRLVTLWRISDLAVR